MGKFFIAILAATVATASFAQNINPTPPPPEPTYELLMSLPVPVIAGDITDRPYRVIGEIETNVRKATIFSKDVSKEKVYRELWERGAKLGADAVINADFGNSRVTALSWGARKATGQAIKFLSDAEIASRTTAEPEESGLPTATISVADELAKFAKLRDDGVISEEEFQIQKAALLGGESSSATAEAPEGDDATPEDEIGENDGLVD